MRLPPGPPLVWRHPDLLGDGQDAFRRGRFAQARDFWEAEGLVARGAEREWITGLAEIAAGFLTSDEGKGWLGERLLRNGLRRLASAPERFVAVDVAMLRTAAELLESALRKGQPADPRAMVLRTPASANV